MKVFPPNFLIKTLNLRKIHEILKFPLKLSIKTILLKLEHHVMAARQSQPQILQ